MATFYEYKCKGCGYTVKANPKGKDMVMMGDNGRSSILPWKKSRYFHFFKKTV